MKLEGIDREYHTGELERAQTLAIMAMRVANLLEAGATTISGRMTKKEFLKLAEMAFDSGNRIFDETTEKYLRYILTDGKEDTVHVSKENNG